MEKKEQAILVARLGQVDQRLQKYQKEKDQFKELLDKTPPDDSKRGSIEAHYHVLLSKACWEEIEFLNERVNILSVTEPSDFAEVAPRMVEEILGGDENLKLKTLDILRVLRSKKPQSVALKGIICDDCVTACTECVKCTTGCVNLCTNCVHCPPNGVAPHG